MEPPSNPQRVLVVAGHRGFCSRARAPRQLTLGPSCSARHGCPSTGCCVKPGSSPLCSRCRAGGSQCPTLPWGRTPNLMASPKQPHGTGSLPARWPGRTGGHADPIPGGHRGHCCCPVAGANTRAENSPRPWCLPPLLSVGTQ